MRQTEGYYALYVEWEVGDLDQIAPLHIEDDEELGEPPEDLTE